jgi:putative iron-regulated protein
MRNIFYLMLSASFSILSACDSAEQEASVSSDVVENYSEIVLANYKDTYEDAMQLQNKINEFIAEPSQARMEAAKDAWLNARESYGQTEAFRFYGGPIDDEDGPEGQLNAWPLDEAYIDYVIGGAESNANIINSPDVFPDINADMIAELNEQGSETNVSSGYHAIEFLLWGQDLSEGPGGGERPYTDYLTTNEGTASNQDRRSTYLNEVTKLLVADLSSLVQEWDSGGNNFRESFTATPQKSIENIISALGKLSKGELAGERMFVAYDLQSKEDEHSCFSDNTHRDIVNNALGIQNVYLGRYETNSGTVIKGVSIHDLLKDKDAELAEAIKTNMEESVAACKAIQPPFDQEILNPEGRERIVTAITLLRAQGDKLAEAASALGFEFDPSAI